MNINQFTKNAYQMLDGYLSTADWVDVLEDIYSDGFVDAEENNLFYYLGMPDEIIRKGHIFYDGQMIPISNEAKSQYGSKTYVKNFNLELYLIELRGAVTEPNPTTPVDFELGNLEMLTWGGIRVTVKLTPQKGREILSTITLPDETNNYPWDFPRDFNAGTLSGNLKYTLAQMALAKAAGLTTDAAEPTAVRTALERLELTNNITLPPLGGATQNALYSIEDPVAALVNEVAVAPSDTMRVAPQLNSPIQTTDEVLPETLKMFPDYVQKAFGEINPTIFYFDTAEIYPGLLQNGSITQAPNNSASFTNSPEKPGAPSRVYMNTASENISGDLGHELGHVVHYVLPAEMNAYFDVNYGTIGRLYAERYNAVAWQPEDSFTTTYQANSVYDYFAEAFEIFYAGFTLSHSSRAGTREELMSEDPKLYLLLTQLDALLKAHYGDVKTETAPPIWAAFTETALTQNEAYLEKFGDAWSAPENLAAFCAETLKLDTSDETAFWQDRQKFAASKDFPENYNEAANDYCDLTARVALKNPNFKLAAYYGMQSKNLDPSQQKQIELRVLHNSPELLSSQDWMTFFKQHVLGNDTLTQSDFETLIKKLNELGQTQSYYASIAAWFTAENILSDYQKTKNPKEIELAQTLLQTAVNDLAGNDTALINTLLIRLAQIGLLKGETNWMGYCEVMLENDALPTDENFSAFPKIEDKKIARKIAKHQELTQDDWQKILTQTHAAWYSL